MYRLFIVCFSVVCVFSACRTVRQASESKTVDVQMVPYAVPNDSLSLALMFECDSNRNVLLRTIDELKSRGVKSQLNTTPIVTPGTNKGKGLRMQYTAQAIHDTLYVPKYTYTITKTYPPKIVKEKVPLSWWEQTQIRVAYFLEICLIVAVLIIIIKKQFFH